MMPANGLSPRVRGNPLVPSVHPVHPGSIPARAGEPMPRRAILSHSPVYPRACGGTNGAARHSRPCWGLSPRVRGNPAPVVGWNAVVRSIPARAGEPPGPGPTLSPSPVYPRACGGTQPGHHPAPDKHGLSPRVRGNQVRMVLEALGVRSIPARAGEPRLMDLQAMNQRVYPRACGGTFQGRQVTQMRIGLSPRVRGNPPSIMTYSGSYGSIPARAGEPFPAGDGYPPTPVYPRACGGTHPCGCGVWRRSGLSPRVRGNPDQTRVGGGQCRSIPARAGEPGIIACQPYAPEGLSPRVRGNRLRPSPQPAALRSIPARAGEPCVVADQPYMHEVYPRACGGTPLGCDLDHISKGLSPRVRGNRHR